MWLEFLSGLSAIDRVMIATAIIVGVGLGTVTTALLLNLLEGGENGDKT